MKDNKTIQKYLAELGQAIDENATLINRTERKVAPLLMVENPHLAALALKEELPKYEFAEIVTKLTNAVLVNNVKLLGVIERLALDENEESEQINGSLQTQRQEFR